MELKLYRPLNRNSLNQKFGKENTMESCMPFYKELGLAGHNGLDWGAMIGEKVYWPSSVEGIVTALSTDINAGYGVTVVSEHEGKIYQQRFWHLSEIKCKVGDVLGSGDLLGLSGNTGKYTTGPHLHWDLKELGKTNTGSYYTLNHENGYLGAIDIEPYFTNEFVCDIVDMLKKKIGLMRQLLELWRKLKGLLK
jgi:murein DD-endopeptidase MepM/ murein hydrolase activator NlpD